MKVKTEMLELCQFYEEIAQSNTTFLSNSFLAHPLGGFVEKKIIY